MLARSAGGGDEAWDPGVEGVVEVERAGCTEVCGMGRECSGRAGRGLPSEGGVTRDRDKMGAEMEVGRCLPIGTVWMRWDGKITSIFNTITYTGSLGLSYPN